MDEARVWATMVQRIGGWAAIAGAALFVAAGSGYGGLTFGREPDDVLLQIAAQPVWYWPLMQSLFVAAAVLWIATFMGLNSAFRDMRARVIGQFAIATLLLGVTLCATDSFISGATLPGLAQQWSAAPAAERGAIERSTKTLLALLSGTWIGVVVLLHGVPFVLIGAAVARTEFFPRPLRWIGVTSGTGCVITGVLMLVAPASVLPAVYFLFAVVGAVWLGGVGFVLKRRLAPAPHGRQVLQGT